MTIRKDILLNECGDVKIDNGDTVLVDGPDQIRQSWLIHMRTIMGELITNKNVGMPWFEPGGILDKHQDLTLVEQYFIDGTLEVPGVTGVNGVEIGVLDAAARKFEISVDCNIEADEGEENQTFNYQGALPLGTCSAISDADFPLSIDGLRVWFDAQDLANMTNDPTVPSLRLENKAGAGYALGVGNGPELLVDGDMEAGSGVEELTDGDMEAGEGPEELTDGDMEAGPGPEELTDGDMEAVGVGAWTAGGSATLTKQTTTPHSGNQCLRVAYNGVSYPWAEQTTTVIGRTYRFMGWARGDGSKSARIQDGSVNLWSSTVANSWQAFDVTYVATTTKPTFLTLTTAAGYSEFDDCSVVETCPDWLHGSAAGLTKETTSPHGGSQLLRVTSNGSWGYAYQNITTIGRTYRIVGWARPDGASHLPRVYDGTVILWTGTASTSWQAFDIIYVASANNIRLRTTANAGYTEFDDVSVKETCPDWTPSGNPTLTKSTVTPHGGLQSLRVAYNGTSNPSAFQAALVVGRSYRITGWARGDGGSVYPRILHSVQLWAGTTSNTWQSFSVDFVAGSANISCKISAAAAGYAEFDDMSVKETCPDWTPITSLLTKSTVSPHGGLQCLRIAPNGGGSSGAAGQLTMTIGKNYRITGWARTAGVSGNAPAIRDGTVAFIWTGTIDGTTWEQFDEVFTAQATTLNLYSRYSATNYVEFDDVSLTEGGGGFPTLTGVTPINNKRAIYLNNTVANFNREHLAFVDTQALRPATNFTVFYVGVFLDDTGVVDYDYGLVSLRGQNDLGTVEEANWVSRVDNGPLTGTDPEYQAYSKTDAAGAASSEAATVGANAFDPFYMATLFKLLINTDFYHDGVSKAGNAVLLPRRLDGDGFIGASLDTDCATPKDFAYGYFGELLVYKGTLTSDQISQLNEWLASKWGF